VLALAAFVWFVGRPILRDLLPSGERVDLHKYLGITGTEDASVMLGENRAPANALVRGGIVYWEAQSVRLYLADNFWINPDEGVLLLTTADEVVRAADGERFYTRHAEVAPADGVAPEVIQTDMPVFFVERGRGYISLDYAKQFCNFSYELFEDPYRIQIYAADGAYEGMTAQRKTSLRKSAGIKSEIVSDITKGETVYVLNRVGDWSKVRTEDALIGYVENRRFSEESFETKINIPQDYAPPVYTSLTKENRLCIGWHLVTVADANAYMNDVIEGAWPLDVISPTWYSVADGSGSVTSLAWRSYVDEAHARGLEVWPLVSDFAEGLDRQTLLMSTASRNAFVSYMIGQAGELGFDGINLDFELVPAEAASGFEQLLRELSVACRAHGLVFSIDNYPPRSHTAHYNRGLQGEIADYVVNMGYDEHWGSSSGAGSVASLPFVRDAIERTLEEAPANKVINAVPFYTRIWSTARDGTVRASAVTVTGQANWLEERELEPIWSEELGQHYTQTDENERLYQVWLEDDDSMRVRIDAMKEYDIGGVACWQLGLSNDSVWDILGEYTRG
jgi:spore germination protein YaaH